MLNKYNRHESTMASSYGIGTWFMLFSVKNRNVTMKTMLII